MSGWGCQFRLKRGPVLRCQWEPLERRTDPANSPKLLQAFESRPRQALPVTKRRDDGGHRRIAFFCPRPFRQFGRLYLATRAATQAFLLLPRAANRRLADQANGHAPFLQSVEIAKDEDAAGPEPPDHAGLRPRHHRPGHGARRRFPQHEFFDDLEQPAPVDFAENIVQRRFGARFGSLPGLPAEEAKRAIPVSTPPAAFATGLASVPAGGAGIDRWPRAKMPNAAGGSSGRNRPSQPADALPDLRPQKSPESENQALRATGTDGGGDLKMAAYRQQWSNESTRKPAESSKTDKEPQNSGDDRNVLPCNTLSEKTRESAKSDEQRRRGDSNPRWRFCTPLPCHHGKLAFRAPLPCPALCQAPRAANHN